MPVVQSMRVRDVIEQLSELDPDMFIQFCIYTDNWYYRIDQVVRHGGMVEVWIA